MTDYSYIYFVIKLLIIKTTYSPTLILYMCKLYVTINIMHMYDVYFKFILIKNCEKID